jgi:hypothetical protein
MSAISEKINAERAGIELIESILDGTLTETRYDLLIEAIAENGIDEAFAGAIYQGKPAWREKHYKRYGFIKV